MRSIIHYTISNAHSAVFPPASPRENFPLSPPGFQYFPTFPLIKARNASITRELFFISTASLALEAITRVLINIHRFCVFVFSLLFRTPRTGVIASRQAWKVVYGPYLILLQLLCDDNKNQAAVLNCKQLGIKECCWRRIDAFNGGFTPKQPVWLKLLKKSCSLQQLFGGDVE